MMKLTVKLISLAIVAVFSLSILAACNIAAPGGPAASATNPAALAGYAYVSMRINPEIELVTDENGEVVAANPINEDGEVVLCEVDMVGMSIDEAIERLEGIKCGFKSTSCPDQVAKALKEYKSK